MSAHCEHCHGMGYVIARAGERAHASVCSCRTPCPTCGDAGFVLTDQDGYQVATPCTCQTLRRRVSLYNAAGLPAAYGEKTMSGYAPGQSAHKARLKTKLVRYVEKQFHLDRSPGLLLVGGPGTGKTHLLAATVHYLTLERGVGCRFVDFFELTTQIRATYDGKGERTEAQIIEELVNVPVLAVDELGKGRSSAWERTIVDQLISRRYNAGRLVLGTTNYVPEALQRGGAGQQRGPAAELVAPSLEERLGARIVSRLTEMCDIELTEGPDYRTAKRGGTRP